MLTYSPEAAFFLTLCDLVLSGLSFVALLMIRYWEGAPSRARGALVIGCALLAASFATQALFYAVAVLPSDLVEERYVWLLFAADAIRLCSSGMLVAALLLESRRTAALRGFLLLALTAVIVATASLPAAWGAVTRTIDPLTPLRLADVLVLGAGTAMLGLSHSVRSVALSLLVLGRASAIPGALWPAVTEQSWGVGSMLVLTGLLLLARTLERESERRLLQYVLRFNLIFLTLAASLIIVLTEISRRQFVDFSAVQIRDVAEFARGHLIYHGRSGRPPETTLGDAHLLEQLVREFGRYPDLRRIALELQDHGMLLEINQDGEINQRFWTGTRPEPAPVAPADFTEALLLREPVIADGRPLGAISLYHSIVPINMRVGRQMKVAFVVFTLFVIVGSVVTGIVVQLAERTIRRQNAELASAQRRLLQMERLASVGAVADGVAHEINNPAGVLVARSDYLLTVMQGKPYAAEIQEDLDTIRRQAQRIAHTVRDLLTSSRKTRAVREPVDISTIVTSAIELVRPVVRDRDVTFGFRNSAAPLLVWGDRDRLEQVFINLLSNGAQAIPNRGTVTVEASLHAGGAWADVIVRDTGVGIPPEYLNRVFERFFTTKEPGAGSGLGLSIVHGIVSEHGGQINVESTPGKGSAFRVTLPACVPESPPRSPTADRPAPAPMAGARPGEQASSGAGR